MSLSQSVISQQHEYVNFAPSWQAGIAGNQGFPKLLKKYNIEAVNVIKTCEKLQLTLQDSVHFIDESQGHDDSEKQCAVRISNMPFRAITNMWFGTLKIYQQQVNNLFRLSKDLLIRSSKNEFIPLQTKKRKSTLNSNKLVKKPRLTCSNYNQLLNEMEKLTQATQQKSVDEFTKVIQTSHSVTQLQIREITIREITATTFTTNDIAEENSGFGEATNEEIVQFLNFMEDDTSNKNLINMNTKPQKRKSTLQRDVLSKQCHYSHDFLEEPILDENVTSNKFYVTTFKRCKSANGESFAKLKSENDIKTAVNENINHQSNNDSDVNKIKQEYIDDCSFEKQNFNQNKITKSKLIIDVCTKIDVNEILHEMHKTKSLKKSSTRKLLKQYKIKRNATALGLLTTFNRRFLKRSHILKPKVYCSRQQFEKDYVNLLRDIFKVNYNHNLASVIYPKYLSSPKKRQQNRTPHLKNQIIKGHQAQQHEILLNSSDDNLNAVVMPFKEFENLKFENQLPNGKGCDNYKANTNHQKDWQPYGVMTKLLNLWRCNQTTEIDSKVLFKLAANRFEVALGFYSLLLLSKNHFVVLTTFPNTITIRTIVMGTAIKSVIGSKI
ncbi:hypothetical protein DOY81_007098 [Sarcophaga bullata]|nr:hypothetical protein DOY81_007098 [Sarcophaga bullata]